MFPSLVEEETNKKKIVGVLKKKNSWHLIQEIITYREFLNLEIIRSEMILMKKNTVVGKDVVHSTDTNWADAPTPGPVFIVERQSPLYMNCK